MVSLQSQANFIPQSIRENGLIVAWLVFFLNIRQLNTMEPFFSHKNVQFYLRTMFQDWFLVYLDRLEVLSDYFVRLNLFAWTAFICPPLCFHQTEKLAFELACRSLPITRDCFSYYPKENLIVCFYCYWRLADTLMVEHQGSMTLFCSGMIMLVVNCFSTLWFSKMLLQMSRSWVITHWRLYWSALDIMM
jgi:hypothetical protein